MKIYNDVKFYILQIILFISCVGLLLGCYKNNCDQLKLTSKRIHTIDKNVYITCPIPEYTCDFTGNNYNPTKKLIECIKKQKEIIDLCREHQDVTLKQLKGNE